MKLLLIITIFLSNLLFSLSNKDFKNIGINKPTTPTQPKEPSSLIKDEKKDIKEIRK